MKLESLKNEELNDIFPPPEWEEDYTHPTVQKLRDALVGCSTIEEGLTEILNFMVGLEELEEGSLFVVVRNPRTIQI